MSLIDLYASRHEAQRPITGGRPRPVKPVLWLVLAVIFLGTSAGVRAWQDRRFEVTSGTVVPLPFPLKELPETFDTWQMIEGAQHELDPQIARIAGATDHLVRTYANTQTGVAVSVMISYGQGQALHGHVPEVCYPSAGYRLSSEIVERAIPTTRGPVNFKSMVFSRDGGGASEQEESYYSFRHEGRWIPDAGANWKQFRMKPSMFKVQAQRRLGPQERRLLDSPTEQFLSAFVSVLEARLAEGARSAAPPAAAK